MKNAKIEREDRYFNELPLLNAEPFVQRLSDIMFKSLNLAHENYLVKVYDLSDTFLPVENEKIGEKVANILAPATLVIEKKNNFEEVAVF